MSSTRWTVTGEPSWFFIQTGSAGVRSLFRSTSVYQNMMSSAPNGLPSDHLAPFRSLTVQVVKSLDGVTLAGYLAVWANAGTWAFPPGNPIPSASRTATRMTTRCGVPLIGAPPCFSACRSWSVPSPRIHEGPVDNLVHRPVEVFRRPTLGKRRNLGRTVEHGPYRARPRLETSFARVLL